MATLQQTTQQTTNAAVIKEGLEALFASDPDVFVAGDLPWHPVKHYERTRVVPGVMVVFGRPKGYRGSYRQWEEDGVALQVVFAVAMPSDRGGAMAQKSVWCDRYGVKEYYIYEPYRKDFTAFVRSVETGYLEDVPLPASGYISPRLGVRFDLSTGDLIIYRPDGEPLGAYDGGFARRAERGAA